MLLWLHQERDSFAQALAARCAILIPDASIAGRLIRLSLPGSDERDEKQKGASGDAPFLL
ncbi:hypothetical protein M3484_17030 [Pseudomonas sp. GX19020]|uniref:hypothetical protein n=1 Tax=Pseudomonas sp. GX19020 TaxID=2942277 RepID=UPI0020190682|nr:hypothetical protein [Pseudomonas sp. GX19020]MCL4068272.1 hypothetical protein [Pseudomonas sp. GX19020]